MGSIEIVYDAGEDLTYISRVMKSVVSSISNNLDLSSDGEIKIESYDFEQLVIAKIDFFEGSLLRIRSKTFQPFTQYYVMFYSDGVCLICVTYEIIYCVYVPYSMRVGEIFEKLAEKYSQSVAVVGAYGYKSCFENGVEFYVNVLEILDKIIGEKTEVFRGLLEFVRFVEVCEK